MKDPVCHQAFEKINDDESRHLGVGFTVMEMQGRGKTFIAATKMLAPLLDPRLMLGIASYVPLLNKMRDNIVEMGLPEERLYKAMNKFERIGGRTEDGRRNPWFRISTTWALGDQPLNRLYRCWWTGWWLTKRAASLPTCRR